MREELVKIKRLLDDTESLINGDKVYADIDIWSEAKEAYENLVTDEVSSGVSDLSPTEKELLSAVEYGYNYHQDTIFPEKSFDENAKANTLKWLKSRRVLKR